MRNRRGSAWIFSSDAVSTLMQLANQGVVKVMALNSLMQRIRSRSQREIADRVATRTFRSTLRHPIVSFTFDDFPKNAGTTGSRILQELGISATYYLSLGLAGLTTPTGLMFNREDLEAVSEAGHEFGCHTFDHSHAWNTRAKAFATSLDRNRDEFKKLMPGLSLESMSYPISCPNPGVKREAARRFQVCRAGGQDFNHGIMDRNNLKSFFLEKCAGSSLLPKDVIDRNCEANGWLIFATHDISECPTQYGCTPDFFAEIARYAANSGARLLPVAKAWQVVRGKDAPGFINGSRIDQGSEAFGAGLRVHRQSL
jgi:hypothetical protein